MDLFAAAGSLEQPWTDADRHPQGQERTRGAVTTVASNKEFLHSSLLPVSTSALTQ